MPFTPHQATTPDGARLALRHYATPTESDAAGTTVVINSAMGVHQKFYEEFAEFLASRGISVVTYDYRGIGDSRHGPVSRMENDLADWGRIDQEAIIQWSRKLAPANRIVLLGHSVGGQIMGLAPSAAEADALVLIASQSGYWGHWRGFMRLQVFLLWHVFIPMLTRLLGYFPSHWFGIGDPLPPRVARQWARWARDPDYLHGKHAPAGAERYAGISRPLLAVWVADDRFATRASSKALVERYSSAIVDFREIHPHEHGRERIGHFAIFREAVSRPIWPMIADWIRNS